jgi:hypothetical protein
VFALAGIAITAIVAEVIILLFGDSTSEALLTIAATAVGGLAGLAVPGNEEGEVVTAELNTEMPDQLAILTEPPRTNPFVDDTSHEEGDLEEWDDLEDIGGSVIEGGTDSDDTEDGSPKRP